MRDEIKALILLVCIPGLPLAYVGVTLLVEWFRKWYEWYKNFPDDDGDL